MDTETIIQKLVLALKKAFARLELKSLECVDGYISVGYSDFEQAVIEEIVRSMDL